jgi:hypothetical protein
VKNWERLKKTEKIWEKTGRGGKSCGTLQKVENSCYSWEKLLKT